MAEKNYTIDARLTGPGKKVQFLKDNTRENPIRPALPSRRLGVLVDIITRGTFLTAGIQVDLPGDGRGPDFRNIEKVSSNTFVFYVDPPPKSVVPVMVHVDHYKGRDVLTIWCGPFVDGASASNSAILRAVSADIEELSAEVSALSGRVAAALRKLEEKNTPTPKGESRVDGN